MINVATQTHPTVRCVIPPQSAPSVSPADCAGAMTPADEANTFDDLKEMLATYG